MTRKYHVGFSKRGRTLVIEAVTNKDYLSCELYDYWGERVITKRQLHASRYDILSKMRDRNPAVYGNLEYAIVA